MENLQMLIDKWKVQVGTKQELIDDSIHVNERRRLRGEQYQLELCITDAELLLNQKPKDDLPPQLNKHDVSGRSEQFCSCSFVMIMIGEDNKPYCGSCKLLVDE